MLWTDFLRQYFDEHFSRLVDQGNIDRDIVKKIFFEGFRVGYQFDFDVLLNLDREIVKLETRKRTIPQLLDEFIREETDQRERR